jgi:hypothetical protein
MSDIVSAIDLHQCVDNGGALPDSTAVIGTKMVRHTSSMALRSMALKLGGKNHHCPSGGCGQKVLR